MSAERGRAATVRGKPGSSSDGAGLDGGGERDALVAAPNDGNFCRAPRYTHSSRLNVRTTDYARFPLTVSTNKPDQASRLWAQVCDRPDRRTPHRG